MSTENPDDEPPCQAEINSSRTDLNRNTLETMSTSSLGSLKVQNDFTEKKQGRRLTVQLSRDEWLQYEGFKSWMILLENRRKVRCSVCKKNYNAHLASLIKHAMSRKHMKHAGLTEPPRLEDFRLPEDLKLEILKKIAVAELQFVAMLIRLNVPFLNAPQMLISLQYMQPDGVWKHLNVGATKAHDLCVNVIGLFERNRLTEILKHNYFSICVDEATDVSKDKTLAIILRYTVPSDATIVNSTWELAHVFKKGEKASSTSARLFEVIKQSFTCHKIPLTNIISICSDGCSTMTGKKNGVATLMENEIPGLICTTCPAHVTHLIARHAANFVPKEVISFLNDIYTMTNTSKRIHNLMNEQIEQNVPTHKILRVIQVRWLQLEACVNRNLEQWSPLLKLAEELAKQKDSLGLKMHVQMNNPEMKCYLLVLQRVLPILNKLNKLFQKDEVVLHEAKKEIEDCYRNVLSIIMNRTYILKTPVREINIFDMRFYLAYIDFDLGEEVRDLLIKSGAKAKEFCTNVLCFITSVALEIRGRFNKFKYPVYDAASCLHPCNATSIEFRKTDCFEIFLKTFDKIIGGQEAGAVVRMQWEKMPFVMDVMIVDAAKVHVNDFWVYVCTLTDENEDFLFQELGSVALTVMGIPHANATPERKFSEAKHVKNDKRNCLAAESLDATIRAREVIEKYGGAKFQPPTEMVDLYLKRDYYKKK